MSKDSEQSESLPGIYKTNELEAMIEMIDAGIWGTKNLSTALHVSQETIIQWKKRTEVQEAHRKAIRKFAKRRTDVEKILSELDVETPQEPTGLTQINNYMNLTDDQLDAVIAAKVGQIGAIETAPREGDASQDESPEVR